MPDHGVVTLPFAKATKLAVSKTQELRRRQGERGTPSSHLGILLGARSEERAGERDGAREKEQRMSTPHLQARVCSALSARLHEALHARPPHAWPRLLLVPDER